MLRLIHVAVGVILGADGTILIAKRPDESHQGGLWEFPGGKVERDETLFEALERELHEELNISVKKTEPLIQIRHNYGDKLVLLDVHLVTEFSGEARGNEGQPILWVAPENLHHYEFPAANRPIIVAIKLPRRMVITGEFYDLNGYLDRAERVLQGGIKFVQLRVRNTETLLSLIQPMIELCNRYSARLAINTNPNVFTTLVPANNLALHLHSKNLLSCSSRPVSSNVLLGASCHNHDEVLHAEKIGVDYICLSPVLATSSHPESIALGWNYFADLLASTSVPVYALGGMTEDFLDYAIAQGAQGIAAISEWW